MTKRRDVIRLLEMNGFTNIGGRRHDVFVKKELRTIVPRHKEISERTFKEIKKQAGLK